MNATILPFKKKQKRDADGVLYVPPPVREGVVYVAFERPGPRRRKKWHVVVAFCDGSHEFEDGPADWATCMFVARVRASKYGFRVVDLTKEGR